MAFRRSNSRVDMFGNLVNTKHFDSELCAFMISVILVTWVSRSSQPGVPSDHQSGCPELDGRGAGQASPDRSGELRQGGDGRRPLRLQETFRQFCDAAGTECRLGQNWAASEQFSEIWKYGRKILQIYSQQILNHSDLQSLSSLSSDIKMMLDKLVVVKLNGALATNLGCRLDFWIHNQQLKHILDHFSGPTSTIPVRDNLTSLDLTVQHLEHLNKL